MINRFKIHLSLLAIIYLSNLNCFAQSDYVPGFIIKTNGDSISGFVKIAEHSFNIRSCSFKESGTSNPSSYSPGDLRAYGAYDSKYFISAIVDLDDPSRKSFLDCIVSGRIELYQLLDRFFVSSSDQLSELKISIRNTSSDGKTYAVKIEEYKSVLQNVMQSCSGIHSTIASAKLKVKDLKELFVEYHNCIGIPFKTYQEEIETKDREVIFGFSGGITFSNLKFNANAYNSFIRDTEASDLTFSPSFLLMSKFGRSQLRSGVSFYSNSFHSTETSIANSARYDLYIKYYRISLPIYLRINLAKRKSKNYLLFGVGFNAFVRWDQKYVASTLISGYVLEETSNLNQMNFYINGLAGFGREFNMMGQVWFFEMVGDIASVVKGGTRQPSGIQTNISGHLGLWLNRN